MSISKIFIAALILLPASIAGQTAERSQLDPARWGVVYDIAETQKVTVKSNVPYSGTLAIDIYSPAAARPSDKRPAVIFLNAIGDRPGDKVKSWGIYSSWPRLLAAHGMVGISMDANAEKIQESLAGLFAFLEKDGAKYGIDPTMLGVYAASANTTQSLVYLMGDGASKGIRAAALYYGASPAPGTQIRKDLPVLFILAEGDLQGGLGQQAQNLWQRVTEAKAPWTLMFASKMIHAFDAFQDDDDSRRIVMQTISFWKTHLERVPQPSWERSPARDIVASTYGNEPQRTADLLTKYVADNPRDAQAFVSRARALNSLGRGDEAVADYERAIELDPGNMFAIGGLGQARFRQQRFVEAELLLSKAIGLGFRNSINYGQLAFAQLTLKKNVEAIKSYEDAFQMGIPPGANTRGIAYYNMACAYARIKDIEKALEMVGKAIDAGYSNRTSMEADEDLVIVRSDPRFAQIVGRIPKPTK